MLIWMDDTANEINEEGHILDNNLRLKGIDPLAINEELKALNAED